MNSQELSAYLDGELDAPRVRQIEAAIENDAAIRHEYQILSEADSAWRAAAQSARFRPNIALPPRVSLGSAALMYAAIPLLLVVRALPKLSDALTWGFMLQGVALGAAMVWVIVFARKSPDLDAPTAT